MLKNFIALAVETRSGGRGDLLHRAPVLSFGKRRQQISRQEESTVNSDLISRQAALDALGERPLVWDNWTDEYNLGLRSQYDADRNIIESAPAVTPTLYGYDIEHLVGIAKALESKGLAPRQVAELFSDVATMLAAVFNEQKQIIAEAVRECVAKIGPQNAQDGA